MNRTIKNYYGGKWQETLGQDFFTVESPFFRGYTIKVSNSDRLDMGDCFAEAKRGSERCAELSLEERCDILTSAAQKFEFTDAEVEHLVKMQGAPISAARQHVEYAGELLAKAAEAVELHHGSVAGALGRSIGGHGYELLVPRKYITSAFIPPNDPAEAAFVFAHTVMSGSAVILKPSQQEPYFAHKLAQLLTECGYPAGGLNVINWDTGDQSRVHMKQGMIYDTDSLVFMGDLKTAVSMLRSNTELWNFCVFAAGKSKAIIDDGADLVQAADNLTYSSMDWTNSCVATKAAVVVGKDNAEALAEHLAQRFKRLTVGNPLGAKTQIGYVSSEILEDMEKAMSNLRDFGAVDFVLPFQRVGEHQMRPILAIASPSDPELIFFKEELPYTLAIVPVNSFEEATNFVNRSAVHLGERFVMATSLYAGPKTFSDFAASESRKYAKLRQLSTGMIFYNRPSLNLSPYLNHQGINLTRFLSRPLTIVDSEGGKQ